MRDDGACVSPTEQNKNAPRRRRRRRGGVLSPDSASGLRLAGVADVAPQVASVLPRVLPVAGEIATVGLQLVLVTLQLVPSGNHRRAVARSPGAGDRVAVVHDFLAVAGDLSLVLAHLSTVGPDLSGVLAHLAARTRGLCGEGAGSAEDRDGADEKRLERGHGSVSR